MPATAGLLLTGGASSRLGAPKAELRRDGERLADRGARLLRAVCDPVLEVGPGVSPLSSVCEDPPGAGPLAALVAGADGLEARGHVGSTLLLAVDLPFVHERLLAWVANHEAPGAVVPTVAGIAQPLCARYAAADVTVAAALRADGVAAMRVLLARIEVTYAAEDAWGDAAEPLAFTDVDTPDAVTRAGLHWPPETTG